MKRFILPCFALAQVVSALIFLGSGTLLLAAAPQDDGPAVQLYPQRIQQHQLPTRQPIAAPTAPNAELPAAPTANAAVNGSVVGRPNVPSSGPYELPTTAAAPEPSPPARAVRAGVAPNSPSLPGQGILSNPAVLGTAPVPSAMPRVARQGDSLASPPPAVPVSTAPASVAPPAAPAANVDPSAPSFESVEALTKQVNDATDLSEEHKKEALERLRSAKEWLTNAAAAEAKIQECQADIAAANLAQEKAKLLAPVQDQFAKPPGETPVSQVELAVADSETRLADGRERLTKLEETIKRRGDRKAAMIKLIAEAQQRIDDASKGLAKPVDTSSLLNVARRMDLSCQLAAAMKQKSQYPIEQQRIESLAEVLPVRRDIVKREVTVLEKEVAHWKHWVGEFRKRDSQREQEKARQQLENAAPALKGFAQENSALAEERKKMLEQIEIVETEIQANQTELNNLNETFEKTAEKVKKAGRSTTIGFLLRRERDHLPKLSRFKERIQFTQKTTPNVHLRVLELQDEQEKVEDLEAVAATLAAQLKESKDGGPSGPRVDEMIKELVDTRRDLLEKLVHDHDDYVKQLGELELSLGATLDRTREYSEFIDQRVLWIRSSEPIGRSDLADAGKAMRYVMSPAPWIRMIDAAMATWRSRIQTTMVMLFLVSFGLLAASRIRKRLHAFAVASTEAPSLDGSAPATHLRLRPALTEFTSALLAALMLPAVMWLLGMHLASMKNMTTWGVAFGAALQATAVTLLVLKFASRICRGNGLGERHFGWPASVLRVSRRRITWLTTTGIPVVLLVHLMHHSEGQENAALGQLALIIGFVLLAIFSYRGLRVNAIEYLIGQPIRPSWRLLFSITRLGGVSVPLLLATFAAMGYDYSALRLAMCCQATIGLAIGVTVLRSLLYRWLAAREQQRESTGDSIGSVMAESERPVDDASIQLMQAPSTDKSPETPQEVNARALIEFTNESGEFSGDVDEVSADPTSEEAAEETSDEAPVVDKAVGSAEFTDSQIRYLLRYAVAATALLGGYLIWSDVMPALGVLDHVQLWSRWVEVKQTVVGLDGVSTIVTTSEQLVTTLKHGILAALLLIVGAIVARCLPALLDLLLLERMPVDTGQRYAAGMILRYLVTVGAFFVACRCLGLTWASIQWLAAGMSVGLGFGLQEVFANLVSGLIILFERPIRVGDLVTVGGVSGRVTKMQIRATTITDYDRRELIVPNKKFITEDVMNWTLTDDVNRIVIEVGVAYGSDVALARDLMMAVANDHPLVMSDPAPVAIFDKFADSSLNLTLRCFLPTLDNRLAVIHELHEGINREFARSKIEIAYPQQDVHLRSIDVPISTVIEPSKQDAA